MFFSSNQSGWIVSGCGLSGIGIPDDKKVTIFDVFTQVDESPTRSYNGAGLGLTLCKRIVETMGGNIGVEDNPGGGSCFWFTLPLSLVENPMTSN